MVNAKQWTAEEIRQNASNWSLEGDDQLLGLMQEISKNLEFRATQTKTNINKMMLSVQETKIHLNNTHNKLYALQNLQFVENRVYDEDETISNLAEVPIVSVDTSKISPIDPAEAVKIAIRNGLQVLDKFYEKVTLDLDDSDDESAGNRNSVVYRSKDPYKDRPLPHLIGSKEWKEKWHIGLQESDNEESNDEDGNEVYSESSGSDAVSLTASLPSMVAESNQHLWDQTSLQKNKTNLFQQSSDEDDLLNRQISSSPSSSQNDVPVKANQTSEGPTIFENKIQSKLNQILKEEVQRISQNQIAVKAPTFQVNLFSDEPPELDIPSTTTQTEKTAAPLNLFLDSDDDSIFNTRPKPAGNSSNKSFMSNKSNKVLPSLGVQSIPVKVQAEQSSDEQEIKTSQKPEDNKKIISRESQPIKKTTVNLFDDDDFDSFMNVLDQAKPTKSSEKVKISSIFDDEPPDDLFDALITANKKSTKRNIFDDDDLGTDQTFEQKIETKSERSKEKPTVPERREDFVSNKKSLFDDNDDFGFNDDRLFEQKNEVTIQSNKEKPIATEKKEKFVPKSNKLFDDDDDIDDFGFNEDRPFEQKMEAKSQSNKENQILTRKKEDVVSKDIKLFDDDDDDIGFDQQKTKAESKTNNKKSPTPEPTNNFLSKNNLFEDLEVEKIKESTTIEQKPAVNLQKTQNLFDDVGNDVQKPFDTESNKNKKETGTLKVKNIFDDYDDFDDEYEKLFEKSKINATKKKEKEIDEIKPPEKESEEQKIVHSKLANEPTTEIIEDNHHSKNAESSDLISKESKPTPSWIDALNFDQPPDDDDDQDFDTKTIPKQNIFEEGDDDFFAKPDEKETSIVQKDNFKTPKTFDFSSSIGLFEDIPPLDDDDSDHRQFLPSTNEPISSANLFEDYDFKDSECRQEQKSAGNEFIFNDEPPPDDESVNITDRDEIDRSTESFQRKLSIFSQTESLEDNDKKLPTDSAIIDQIKPKKLKTNLNINVKALLPGARGPLNKNPSNETKPPSHDFTGQDIPQQIPDEDEPPFDRFFVSPLPIKKSNSGGSESIDQSIPTVLPQSSDRLVSLSKSRAKLPVHRRQSTRKGRQDQYRKSLVTENEVNQSAKEVVQPKDILEKDSSQRRDSKHSSDLVIQSDNLGNKVLLDSGTPIKKSFVFYNDEDISASSSSSTWETDADQQKPIDNLLRKDLSSKPAISLESSNLFGSDDDDADLFSTIINTERKSSKEAKEIIEDLPKSEKEPDKQRSGSTHSIKSDAKKKNNIFDDLEEDPFSNVDKARKNVNADSDAVRQSNLSQQFTEEINSTTNQLKSKQKNIFDDDVDEDYLFPNATTKINRKDSEPTKPITIEKKESSLFSDEEEDDNGLFGGTSKSQIKLSTEKLSTIAKVPEKPIKSKGLFNDSSDDEDDLFGIHSKASSSSLINKSNRKEKSNNPPMIKSKLFDDSDNDEDLFATEKTEKPQKFQRNREKVNRSEPKKMTTSNDPLADLLK